MRRWIILATIVLLTLSLTAYAFAQDATPPAGTVPLPPDQVTTVPDDEVVEATPTPAAEATEVAPEETITDTAEITTTMATTDVASGPVQAYMTIDLGAGFALDPFFVSVNGGGQVDASTLDPSCAGWISERPVIQLNWSGEAEFAEAFIYSDHNPSLVIETPDGDFLCNDDTNDLLLDPTVEVSNPANGTYNIWIGNIDNVGLIPAVLVITGRSEVNTGTFDLDNLVQRPAIREKLLDAADVIPGFAEIRDELAAKMGEIESTDIVIEADSTVTFTQPVTGSLPGFIFPTSPASPFEVCSGVVNPEDVTLFTVPEDVGSLNIFAESSVDSTLIIVDPDGLALCTDESPDGVNRNPQLLLEDLLPGHYALLVGSIGTVDAEDGPVEAIVTITADMGAVPAVLTGEELGGTE